MKFLRKLSTSTSGFTLIELLIVIAIIGILTGIILTNFTGARERARDSKRKQDLKQIQTALQIYNSDYGKFPNGGAGGTISGCGASGTSVCAWGTSAFSAGNPTTVYMGTLPTDPLNSGTFVYTYVTDAAVDFKLTAQLENLSDPDIGASQRRCGVAAGSEDADTFMICNQ